jgi:pilus assembly protein Flp/PilA
MTKFIAQLQALLASFRTDDEGATAVEYGLMVALIAVVIIAAVTLLGTNLSLFRMSSILYWSSKIR